MFSELLQACKDRYGSSDTSIGLAQWISENTSHKKKPFSYERYPFQQAIADDEHPNLACEKCSQVGLTEVQIRKFFAFLRRNSAIKGIFTLPNTVMFQRVYNTRMKPILEADPIFNPPTDIKPVRRMDLVQIFDSFGYITGCTEGDATSIDADFLMHDELDLSPQDMIGLFQSRLQNSDMKLTQAFSTPTFLDFGINRSYQLTDQREYFMKCHACGEQQIPQFTLDWLHIPNLSFDIDKVTDLTPEQIAGLDLDGTYVKCCRCHARLDLSDGNAREWVAAFPTRTAARGYKVRPFSAGRIAPGYALNQLAKFQQRDFVRGFHNTVLGEPFTESSAQIQRNEIERVMTPTGAVPNLSRDVPVFLGMDMGQICHLTLHTYDDDDAKARFVLFEQIPIYMLHERMHELRQIYSIVQGCVDRFPYTPTVDQMRDDTGGLIMPVSYRGTAIIQPHRDELGTTDYYNVNRTAALDRVRTVICNQQAVLSGYGAYKETLITHLRDMVRDEKPEAEPEWKKLNGNDHFFHSMALSLLARRVCEHVYAQNSSSLMSSAILMGVPLQSSIENIPGARGADRLSRLGRL